MAIFQNYSGETMQNLRGLALMALALIVVMFAIPLIALLAPRAHAGETVVMNCEWGAGYVAAMAHERDAGKSEEELIAQLPDEMNWRMKLHLKRQIHSLFMYRKEISPEVAFWAYWQHCGEQRGVIVENDEDDPI
jgi:hypothetical protein